MFSWFNLYQHVITSTDILALAAAISELTVLTRKARTANWCALQMATIDNPDLESLGIVLQQHDGLRVYRVIQPRNHDKSPSPQ